MQYCNICHITSLIALGKTSSAFGVLDLINDSDEENESEEDDVLRGIRDNRPSQQFTMRTRSVTFTGEEDFDEDLLPIKTLFPRRAAGAATLAVPICFPCIYSDFWSSQC